VLGVFEESAMKKAAGVAAFLLVMWFGGYRSGYYNMMEGPIAEAELFIESMGKE